MKLLRIKVMNLNSLYGEQDVDIDGALGGSPLFLIMGPTGAGKTTLMDAVSLALFGQTPRLRTAKSKAEPDEDSRNVISRGTGEALAQVEVSKVEAGKNVRYRATWSCRRARGKADGAFQDPRRMLERREPGAEWVTLVDEQRERYYKPEFDRFLEGMTVEDFKRSMLLAQGEFAAFLKANEDERASILERLTETAVYKDLGARAANRWREAQQALKLAEAALQDVELMREEEETALRAELGGSKLRHSELRDALTVVTTYLTWSLRRAELEQSLVSADAKLAAAEAERTAHADPLRRLAEFERCGPAAQSLRELDRLRAELSRLRGSLPALAEAEQRLRGEVAAATARHLELARAVDAAERALKEAAPELARARTLRAELAQAQTELSRATAAAQARQTALGREQEQARRAESELTQANRALAEATRSFEALDRSRPLVEAMAGLQARGEALAKEQEELAARRRRRDADERSATKQRAELHQLVDERTSLQQKVVAAAEANRLAKVALDAALGGAEDVTARRKELREHQDRLGRTSKRLDELTRLAAERSRMAAEVEQSAASLAGLRVEHAAAAASLDASKAQRLGVTNELERRKQKRDDQRFLLSIARERPRLTGGEPCPLCGGTEHPYVDDPHFKDVDQRVQAECAELDRQVATLQTELERMDERIRTEERVESSLAARISSGEQQRVALTAKLAEVSGALQAGCRECELDPADLAGARSRLEVEAEALEKAHSKLEEADRMARGASEAAAKSAAELERLDAVISERRQMVDAAQRALVALTEDLRLCTERIDVADAALRSSLSGFGIDVSRGLDAALSLAVATARQVRTSQQSLELARTEAQAAQASLDNVRVRLASAEAAAAEAERERLARMDAVAKLEPAVLAVLGGELPDAVERRLDETRASAKRAEQQSLEALQTLTRAQSQAEADHASRSQQVSECTSAVGEASSRLEGDLLSLELADEAALRALLPSQGEVEALTALRARLHDASERARALQGEYRARLEQHLGGRPEVPPELEALPADALSEKRAALEAELQSHHTREVMLVEKLTQQEKERARYREKQKALDAARSGRDLWERMHTLIGVKDGDAFKRYAQTLNLAELMERANHHLQQLAPRYSLVGATGPSGESRLAFAIRDSYQAGEIRPINTLSGGETFLVSLSLALALAGYRTVKMPIETLLLDEGFGMLDPETLQVAMGALEALNASGTQVGIISHVEALKERVPARVIVSRDGNGRSSVRVEAA